MIVRIGILLIWFSASKPSNSLSAPTRRPSQPPTVSPTAVPSYSMNPTISPSKFPTASPNYIHVNVGDATESNRSFLVYHFSSGVQSQSMIYPEAPLNTPYLHVHVRSLFSYQVGYKQDFNFSGSMPIVSAPNEMYIDMPLIPPTTPEFVDVQDAGSSVFAHRLWGIAIDGVPIYAGLVDNGVDFIHLMSASPTSITANSAMKVDYCGGSYGPTADNGGSMRYHYRCMPTCLLMSQQAEQVLKRQQYVDDIYQLLDAFTGINGAQLLGYTLKGYPIYSPYDARGHLQTNLDNCNGKFVNGSYGYYVTPTFPYIVGCDGPGVHNAEEVGVAGEYLADTVGTSFSACPRGHYPTTDRISNGCARCPAGRYSPVSYSQLPAWLATASAIDVAEFTCSGVCPVGSYCPEASVKPVPCPAGRYGSSKELGTELCSGECRNGYFCRPGSTTPTQYPCGLATFYCPAGAVARIPVTVGYYSTPEGGPESARDGQLPCGPGTWCSKGVRAQCPAGQFGTSPYMTSANCTDLCPAGSYCPTSSTEPVLCPAGTYGSRRALSDASCSGKCSAGYWCPAGSTSPVQQECPGGIYGAEAGLISAECSPLCEPGGAPNATTSVADKHCQARPCEGGYYCPRASTSPRQRVCGGGDVYCPAGSTGPTQVDVGYYSVGEVSAPGGWQVSIDELTRTAQRQCEPGTYCLKGVRSACPAGYYTDEYGSHSTTCKAPCTAGFYCAPGSASPVHLPCGNSSVYCPQGSSEPLNVPMGYYTHKTSSSTPTDIFICPRGSYCRGGVIRPCPAGTFADGEGAHTPLCGGLCSPGHYCPIGSTSKYMVPCPAGKYGHAGETMARCSGQCDPGYYCTLGSASPRQNLCGNMFVYCPLGSSFPLNVTVNHFSTGGGVWTRSAQAFCSPHERNPCPSTTVRAK